MFVHALYDDGSDHVSWLKPAPKTRIPVHVLQASGKCQTTWLLNATEKYSIFVHVLHDDGNIPPI